MSSKMMRTGFTCESAASAWQTDMKTLTDLVELDAFATASSAVAANASGASSAGSAAGAPILRVGGSWGFGSAGLAEGWTTARSEVRFAAGGTGRGPATGAGPAGRGAGPGGPAAAVVPEDE